jgi:ArsR family transcriptional regulator, arsenate/arsenite/antimonite-responsive transcriptional repressor
MDEIYLAERLAALGHVTRLRAVKELLAAPDGLPAGKLADCLNVRQNSLSPHLSCLSRNGLISGAREGREVIYAAQTGNLKRLLQQLHAFVSSSSAEGGESKG